jgi:hypothetical protein
MPIIRAYVVDIKYAIEDNIVVYLYCRREDKKIIVLRDYYRPNFYVYPKKNQDLSFRILSRRFITKSLPTFSVE